MGAEAIAAFVAGLGRGLALAAAARAAGFALSSFYHRRRRDPEFDLAWDQAMERSSGPALLARLPGRPIRLGRRRRLRLTAARRAALLETLAQTCNLTEAAAEAGVDRATVYRALRRDPELERASAEALLRGFDRLEAVLAAERAGQAARIAERGLETWQPTATPARDFETQMRLLERYMRPARRPAWGWRRPPARGHEEILQALERRLAALRIPVGGEDGAAD